MSRHTITVRGPEGRLEWTDKDPEAATASRSWWGHYADMRAVRLSVRAHWRNRRAADFTYVVQPPEGGAGTFAAKEAIDAGR